MNVDSILSSISARARLHGIPAIGFTPATDAVIQFAPWAKTVISAAIPYCQPYQDDVNSGEIAGAISRVARSEDYHITMRNKLSGLSSLLTEHGCSRQQICVDTDPLPERHIAYMAGITWIGRNHSAFVPGLGSYVSLGEILIDLDFPRSREPLQSQCGNCDICIQACPTTALDSSGSFHRHKCVSHLTQSSGIIPIQLRAHMGNSIYGCDICQQVCPKNVYSAKESTAFSPSSGSVELKDVLTTSVSDLKARFSSQSYYWIGATRLRRNAIIAAGNLAAIELLEPLREMLTSESVILRSHAAWALGQLASPQAHAALTSAISRETNSDVLAELLSAIQQDNC